MLLCVGGEPVPDDGKYNIILEFNDDVVSKFGVTLSLLSQMIVHSTQ